MKDIPPFFKGPFVQKKEIEKPIHFLPPKEDKKLNNIINQTPWNYAVNTKSNKYFKLLRDFKDANLEGTIFYRDYRIKKN